MKRFAIPVLLLMPFLALGQAKPLPYNSGFDNATEKFGWKEYRLGEDHNYSWTYANFEPATPPTALHHDYPVGQDQTANVVEDWYVSPQLQFNGSASISLKLKGFVMTGSLDTADHIGIWYSSSEADPAMGTYVEVADITELALDGDWMDTTSITIPATSGPGYIAIVYRSRWNWLVVDVDDIRIESLTSGLPDGPCTPLFNASVYPNPAKDKFVFNWDGEILNTTGWLSLYDMKGQEVLKRQIQPGQTQLNAADFPAGMYHFVLRRENAVIAADKFLLTH